MLRMAGDHGDAPLLTSFPVIFFGSLVVAAFCFWEVAREILPSSDVKCFSDH